MSKTNPKISSLGIERSAPSTNVTLLPDSPRTQIMNPSVDIDVTLPSADRDFDIINQSTNTITLKSSNGSTILVSKGGRIHTMPVAASPVAPSDWYIDNAAGTIDLTNNGITNLGTAGFARMNFIKNGNGVAAKVDIFVDTQNTGGNLTGTLDFSLPATAAFLYPDGEEFGEITMFTRYVLAGNNSSDVAKTGALHMNTVGAVEFVNDRSNSPFPIITSANVISSVGGAVTGHRFYFQAQVNYLAGS
jgi:hypothetical protein